MRVYMPKLCSLNPKRCNVEVDPIALDEECFTFS